MVTINGKEIEAGITDNRIAVRHIGPYNNLAIDGIAQRVLRVTPSDYIPGVMVLTVCPQ